MFRRILIALDRSEASRCALRTGANLAALPGACVLLVHVVGQAQGQGGCTDSELDAAPIREARKLLASQHGEFDYGLWVEDKVAIGLVAEELVAAAVQWGADLVVIGDHDTPTLPHYSLGATTQELVRRAPCPVLIVRERAATTQSFPIRRRVCSKAPLSGIVKESTAPCDKLSLTC